MDTSVSTSLLLFISYSSHERPLALRFKERLRALGHRTWHDVDDIHLGGAWDDALDTALKACDAVVGLMSPFSIASGWVLNEWAAAEAYKKGLFLALTSECIPPARYIRQQHLRYDPATEDDFFSRLDQELRRFAEDRRAERKTDAGRPALVPTTRDAGSEGAPGAVELERLRRFEVAMERAFGMAADERGRLWICDGGQVQVYELDRAAPAHRWFLGHRPWKRVFDVSWKGRLLAADWDGGLYGLDPDEDPGGVPIRRPGYSALPVHLVAAREGRLVAATWDGQILVWEAGSDEPAVVAVVAHIPRHVVPLADGGVAIADEAGAVHRFEAGGARRWSRTLEPPVRALWELSGGAGGAIAALASSNEVVALGPDGAPARRARLRGEPVVWAHRDRASRDRWTAFATTQRELEWYVWATQQLVEPLAVTLPFSVRRMTVVEDAGRPTLLQAIGLSDEGRLFSTCERTLVRYGAGPVDDFALAAAGHLLICRSGRQIDLYRNPAMTSASCSARVVSVDGALSLGAFRELGVTVVNDGAIPIRKLTAELSGDGRVEAARVRHETVLQPGQQARLAFHTRGLAVGSRVPLSLALSLEDLAGPPARHVAADLHVEIAER